MLHRREFIGLFGSLLLSRESSPKSLLMISTAEAERVREFAKSTALHKLSELADSALRSGPWSVTFHRPESGLTGAGSNDYFSEGPYWWPDPNNPGGPYIRRDGQRNPHRFNANHDDLGRMSEAVLALGIGAYFLNKPDCSKHAQEILSVWFVEQKTRMNPNLEYGQAIRGLTTGRGTGIIDTVSLIHAVQGVVLLEASGMDSRIARDVRSWFGEYLRWLTTSAKGLDEKTSGNNHATWWTAQVAAYAIFTGDTAAQGMAWEHYRNYLVPSEIRADGSCPREEARTNSLGYSSMNLDAFAVICRLAQVCGVNLWRFQTQKGIGVKTAFDYLVPFVLHPETWRKPQISRFSPNGVLFPGLAGLGLPSQELLSAYRQLPRADSPWIQFIDLIVKAHSSDTIKGSSLLPSG